MRADLQSQGRKWLGFDVQTSLVDESNDAVHAGSKGQKVILWAQKHVELELEDLLRVARDLNNAFDDGLDVSL